MKQITDEYRFLQAISCLNSTLYRYISPLASKLSSTAQEIRLRVNRPLAIVCTDITYYLTIQGGLVSTPLLDATLCVKRSDIVDTFNNICNYSVYNHQNEIINGFVTMNGGHRAGLSGTAVQGDGKIKNIRDISSINIRIAREYIGCAKNLAQKIGDIRNGGVLLCGAPCSGKTTVLRDYARMLSYENSMNVALIDERGELASTSSGVFQNDIGFCDVYDGYKKSDAMLHAIRSMAPDIIVCDEIGSEDDVRSIEQAVNCGVIIIASVHASSVNELRRKHNIMKLFELSAFSKAVLLSGKNTPGEITDIISAGDIYAC